MASVEVNSHLNSHAFLVDSDDIGCWGIGASGYTGAFRDSWNISGLNSDDDRVHGWIAMTLLSRSMVQNSLKTRTNSPLN